MKKLLPLLLIIVFSCRYDNEEVMHPRYKFIGIYKGICEYYYSGPSGNSFDEEVIEEEITKGKTDSTLGYYNNKIELYPEAGEYKASMAWKGSRESCFLRLYKDSFCYTCSTHWLTYNTTSKFFGKKIK